MDVRIPFAINKATGALVEVGDVPQGRKCGCLCPSCSQSVVARHGKIREWHFAHDRDAEDKPTKECDISFDSCCRQFALDMMLAGSVSNLQTPDWILTGRGLGGRTISVCVTKGRSLDNVVFRKHNHFDLACGVGDREFLVHLEYHTRHLPDLAGVTSAVLEIDIGVIKRQYPKHQSKAGLIRELIAELIEKNTEDKQWLLHPSLEGAKAELKRKVGEDRAPYIPPQPDVDYEWDYEFDELRSSELANASPPEKFGTFSCVMCSSRWKGMQGTDRDCPKCRTHLYATFLAAKP